MKYLVLALIGTMALNQAVQAADTSKSPYDSNPACMDRNVDSSKGDCVIPDDGTPRHKYPPRTTKSTTAAPAAAPAASPKMAGPGGR